MMAVINEYIFPKRSDVNVLHLVSPAAVIERRRSFSLKDRFDVVRLQIRDAKILHHLTDIGSEILPCLAFRQIGLELALQVRPYTFVLKCE